MENMKNVLDNLETVELQILGGLQKITSGHQKEGRADLEKVARRTKASVKSLQAKCTLVEQERTNMRKETLALQKRVAELESAHQSDETLIETLQEQLVDSQCLLSASYSEKGSSQLKRSASDDEELVEPTPKKQRNA